MSAVTSQQLATLSHSLWGIPMKGQKIFKKMHQRGEYAETMTKRSNEDAEIINKKEPMRSRKQIIKGRNPVKNLDTSYGTTK